MQRVLVFAIMTVLASCSQWSGNWSSSQEPFPAMTFAESSSTMNYAYVQEHVLVPYCISCHGNSGGVNLETIDSIRQNKDKIIAAIVPPARTMPLGQNASLMQDSDRRILYYWLESGAPQGTGIVPPAWVTYPPLSAEEDKLKDNYAYVRENILIPKCISCHGSAGKISLESLAAIQANAHAILKATLGLPTPTMPKVVNPPAIPARMLTADDKQVLYNWLTAGAPENGPTAELPPLQPTFDDINKRVLQVRCMDCHDPSLKIGQKHPLDKNGLLNVADPDDGPPVTPGDPAGSVLIKTLNQNDPVLAPMPPLQDRNKHPTGYAKVPQDEIEVISLWIKNGAKD